MDLDGEASSAGWRTRRVHSQEKMAGSIGLELFTATDQDRHALRLQSGDQGSGRSRNHGKAGAGSAGYPRRIAGLARAGTDLQNVSRLQVYASISPGLRSRDGEGIVSSGCGDLELGRSRRNESCGQQNESASRQGKGLHDKLRIVFAASDR